MKGKKIEDYINHVDEELLGVERLITQEKLDYLNKNSEKYKFKTNKRILTVVFLIFIWICIFITSNKYNIVLAKSVGNIKAQYIERGPRSDYFNKIEDLNEEEIFSKYNTIIVEGQVKEVRNIKIEFNGDIIYCAIVEIELSKVYRGDCKVGQLISILTPCMINIGLDVLDNEVIPNLRVGMNGIFMPIKYDQKSYLEDEGTVLYFEDLAEYGLLDGQKYAFLDSQKYTFLEGKQQLIFDKNTFKSIKNATNLEELESYIKKMID